MVVEMHVIFIVPVDSVPTCIPYIPLLKIKLTVIILHHKSCK